MAAAALSVAGCSGSAEPSLPPLVLTGGTVIAGSDLEPIPDAAVVVEDGMITEIGPAESVTVPEDAVVVDVDGRTVMPGLVDARTSQLLNRLPLVDGAIESIAAEAYLHETLRAGVTTVREAGGWDWETQQNDAEGYRSALDALGNTVPTVVNTGTSIGNAGGLLEQQYADAMVPVSTAEEAAQVADRLIDLGVDQVNVVLTAGAAHEAYIEDRTGLPATLSREQIEAIVATAHARGIEAVAQGMYPEEARLLVDAGADQLLAWPVDAEPLPDDLIDLLASREIPVVSAFNLQYRSIAEGDVRRFLDAGGTLVFGMLAPNSGALSDPHREFFFMTQQGMTPEEIVRSATVDAAGAVGLGDEVGTLETGKRADIIVVAGDPLADIAALRQVTHVVKGGELVVRPDGEAATTS